MAEAKEEWKIPKLTAENHDAWFRRNKVKLKGKRVFYVCEKSLEKHCQIATPRDLSDAVKELDITDNKTAKVCINVDKRDKREGGPRPARRQRASTTSIQESL
ncbi:hypothetical protein PtrV1_05585 [Pyrenophora tritici-repentis]|nr:hypothetical protein PtrV1_05585 [Pyrenophora tritici-repentis]KAF7450327.1 hypothetical protein A1F99_049430 [Pyrenophora tritici-repentis]